MRREVFADYFKKLQDSICNQIAEVDGGQKFKEDLWEREGGGGGRSRVLINGNILEKAGVNFSAVFGELHPKMVTSLKLENDSEFFATGVSIVMHPENPWVPIIHMNVRYFELSNGKYWFGGGIDLTPHIVIPEQAQWFHQEIKKVCDRFDKKFYPDYKKWADDYFFNSHRDETRGIGGIFFDYIAADPLDLDGKLKIWEFVKAVGESFAPIYSHLMQENALKPYGKKEKDYQLLRRGRYVEFNLIHDRGTKFGLETNGRTESILMSLPPLASWEYMYDVESSDYAKSNQNYLKKGVNFIQK